MKSILIIYVAAIVLLAASCGGSQATSATTHTAPIDPCQLLTQEEAAAAINEQVGAPTREDNNPDLLCTYTNSATNHSISVTSNTGKTAKHQFKTVNDIVAHDMVVDDLGDGAFISKTRGIYVVAGNAFFVIKIKDDSPQALPVLPGARMAPGSTELPQATRDKLIALARKAIARL
ncbi:MAG: hypothetical protein ABR577_09765 [Pyrinomonadaceae bacterium]